VTPLLYYWYDVRLWWFGLPDRIAWRCAWLLPRRVALFAFVRVYAVLDSFTDDYDRAYRAFESGKGR
jgi:hypothetical protein